MKGYIISDHGRISVDAEVIAKYAGLAAVECSGVVGMAMVSVKDGLVKLLRRESLTKGVDITIKGNDRIIVDFHIITVYGVPISTISENLIQTVKYKVEQFTGMHVEKVNVYVEGVRVIDD